MLQNRASGNRRMKTITITTLGLLVGIEIILALTPLGSLPIGPLVATTAHIPVIIAACMLGTGAGAFMGFVFGLLSFLVMTFMPGASALTAFVFTPFFSVGEVSGNAWSLVICFVPRILLGVSCGLIFKGISRFDKRGFIACPVAAIISTLLHTCLVLGGIYVFFGPAYAQAVGLEYSALLGALGVVIGTNGVLEAVLAGVLAIAVVVPLRRILKRV